MTTYPVYPILLVDDEEQFLRSAKLTLKSAGFNNIQTCSDSREVQGMLKNEEFSLVALDMRMPFLPGEELAPQIIRDYPDIPLIIITALNDVELAVDCMKMGAFDYIVKPVDNSRLVSSVKRAMEMSEVRWQNKLLKQYLLTGELQHPEVFEEIVTQNSTMRAIFQYLEAVAQTYLPVLITGETGVGKELIAKSIHRLSRRKGEFVTVNVAGLDDTLFSDTLFGHKKGAFTGADDNRKGLIEQATEGTLFMDEIGDLSMESQVKLLRLLQESKYYPLGSDVPKVSDARVVVATNCNLDEMQAAGTFRKDLYYRLKSHHVHIPPLRERREDIVPLVDHFLEKAANELKKKKPTSPKELFTLLRTYSFPGNIRELEGMIYDALSLHTGGILSLETFKVRVGLAESPIRATPSSAQTHERSEYKGVVFLDPLPSMKEIEDMLIEEALKRADGNQTLASQLIGMSRKALNNRLIRSKK
ncbi:MAG: sigma-54-dependent Fis family transcriptional regulator [Calditrichaeota bacterium]|nr:sigma-54-dependent Fis family transcriptional regulator [Calditrichota bacterium]